MKKNKKIFASVVSATALVSNLLLPAFAQAFAITIPGSIDVNQVLQEVNTNGINSITNQIENRYGFDKNTWLTAKRKESAPRVEISFDNTNPKPGEKVTAHAVPEFFKNDPQNLYYTWYIIHTKDGKIQSATNSINEGKIEAAGIMARGDYDPNLDGQTYVDPNKDLDNDGWPPIDSSYGHDKVAAPMGGADGVGGIAKENVEAFDSAAKWCDSLGGHSWDNCSYNDQNSFRPLNTYFTLQSDQANHYCNLCKDYFSGGGLTAYNTAKATRNSCCYNSMTNTDCTDGDGNPIKCPFDPTTDYCGVTANPLFDSCYDSFKGTNKGIVTACLDPAFSDCKTNWSTVHQDANGDGFSDLNEEDTTQVSRCFKHNFGTNANASVFRQNELSSSTTSDDSGLDYSVPCEHKWKDAKTTDCTSDDCKSGSGKFPTGEEKYWKTDPTDPDTDGDGVPDEGDVIGLNQQSFTWNYQPGDRVGVVVEGTSMIPTDEKNAYYKIMWGYLDVCDSTKSGLMDNDQCEGSGDFGFGYLATEAPNEQGDDKLKISLTSSPDNPLADPSSENSDNILDDGTITDADQITVTSSLDNTDYNPNSLYYTWQISKGDPQKNDWTEIKDIPGNFNTTTPSAGMGITQFTFSPKKSALSSSSDLNYFKVTLTASKASDLTAGRGRSSVIIPVNTKGVKITFRKVDIKDGKAVVGDKICNEGLYQTLCPVVHGQIVAAEVSGSHYKSSDSQFSWTVDGAPAYPPANASQLFDGWGNTTIFFPITKDEQEIENISVTATSKNDLQPATGSRLATVVHPTAFIKSGDTSLSQPKVYTAADPNQKDTYQNIESSDAFEAQTNTLVPYYLDFVPYYLLGEDSNTQINWSVNGTDISSSEFYANNPNLGQIGLDNNNRTIKLPTDSTIGAFTTLSATVNKYWSEEERGIAYTAWGVAPNTLSGNSSVSIESVSAPTADVVGSTNNPGQILAAIGTHLPHYFMYLLRLVLTMVVMFVASAGFYGLTQILNFDDDEK